MGKTHNQTNHSLKKIFKFLFFKICLIYISYLPALVYEHSTTFHLCEFMDSEEIHTHILKTLLLTLSVCLEYSIRRDTVV